MINKFLEAVSDADLLQAAIDVLSEKGWALDEGRELPFEADYQDDPEAAFEIEAEWNEVQAETVGVLWDRLSDEERVELWLRDCAGQDPDDPVDAETIWERMEAAVVEKLGSVYEDTGACVTEACVRALRLTSAKALARVLGLYEAVRADAQAHWGGSSTVRTFDVEEGTVVVRSEGGAVEARLRPAFAEGEDEGAVLVEYFGDALREVGLD
ncbi:hypothetical protein [Actinomyces naeslundii]|uniref:hypothetical protein n=1 Tax=Actinomyces naeslundii TaxID=1655 RepID=UPI003C6EE5D5